MVRSLSSRLLVGLLPGAALIFAGGYALAADSPAAKSDSKDCLIMTGDLPVPPMPPVPGHGRMVFMNQVGTQAGPIGIPFGGPARDKNLSSDDAKRIVDGQLAFSGNKRLKAGKVTTEKESLIVEVLTIDGSLVDRIAVDPKTGASHPGA